MNRRASLSYCCLTLAVLLTGCGYHAGQVFDKTVATVALPIFENRTFYRGVEFDLSEALAKQIESTTPYKVVDESVADTVLVGTVTRVEKRLLGRQFGTGLPQEIQVVVVASFEWKNLRTGEIMRKRSRMEGTHEYIPTRTVGEPFESARRGAIDQLSVQIVDTMRGNWGR